MLKMTENIKITGKSIIDDVEVCGFQAEINSANPAEIKFTDWQINKDMYKANRAACRSDLAEFEDYAYSVQDELLAKAAESVEAES